MQKSKVKETDNINQVTISCPLKAAFCGPVLLTLAAPYHLESFTAFQTLSPIPRYANFVGLG